MNRKELLALLDAKGVSYELVEHEAVHTIDDMRALGLLEKGLVGKNLFLRNDNGKKHYLVFCGPDVQVDLKELRPQIGSSRLSFASDDRLAKHLGLTPGAVTPFGLLNAPGADIAWCVDSRMVGAPKIGVHPMDNEATLYLSWDDLRALVSETGNPIITVTLS